MIVEPNRQYIRAPESSSFWSTRKFNTRFWAIPCIRSQDDHLAGQRVGTHFNTMSTWESAVLADINQYLRTLRKMAVCRKLVGMVRTGSTVVRMLSSLQGAKTSVKCHANHSQHAHVSGSGVRPFNHSRGDENMSGFVPINMCLPKTRGHEDRRVDPSTPRTRVGEG